MSIRPRIAIVYDWMDKWGGVERILLTLHRLLPQAVFFTSFHDREKTPWSKDLTVLPSFIQNFPDWIKKNRILSLPFYPYAFESFNFNSYDIVISVTSSFAKGIITQPKTKHICILLTPMRYLWIQPDYYINNPLVKKILRPNIDRLKKWDIIASKRPDTIIAISRTVADRCRRYYQREASVIYPGFDEAYWKQYRDLLIKQTPILQKTREKEKYYLIVSRLESYKRVDLVIDAFKQLPNENLIVVGEGSQLIKLKMQASSNIEFRHNLTDEELSSLYYYAQALIMPQEEDFGYVALEAQYFGCPVIAYLAGGARETVIEGKTGIFFKEQTVESLVQALARYHTISYNLKVTTKALAPNHLKQFHQSVFLEKINQLLRNN